MNPAGQVTQDTLGNGVLTTRAFDAVTHFLTSVQSGEGGGTALQNLGYLYDVAGNVSQRQNNNLGLTESFYYDGDNRLSYSTLNGTQNLSLNYDVMGDITNRSDVAGNATWTYDPTHKHQVTEAGSTAYQYRYDSNGNMISRAGSSVTWTSDNYPSSISDSVTGESVSFSYGPDRKPWVETTKEPSGTTEIYRLGSLMDTVVAGTGDTDRDYIYAGNEPVAVDERSQSSNSFYYFLTDQQGGISGITNASGQSAVNESFTAYGARRNPATWSGTPSSSDLTTIAGITQHGYTFQRALGEQMGLNDMVGRVQDAVIGRFLSADPTDADPTDPQDWNDYSYTDNNPLTYVDPTGFKHNQHGSGSTNGGGAGVDGGGAGDGGAGVANSGSSSTPMSVPTLAEVDVSGEYTGNDAGVVSMSILTATGDGYAFGSPPKVLPPQSNPLQPVTVTATYETSPLQQVVVTPYDPSIQECTGCWVALFGGFVGALDDSLAAVFRTTTTGATVYRVFGGEAKGAGQYWTTVNPGSIADYRTTAGLFPGNTGQFVIQGTFTDTSGVTFQLAAPGPGGIGGGLAEVFVPNPEGQISITGVSGVNPPF